MTQERIEQMRNQIKADEKYGKGPNYASWSDECGVLLSRKEAQEILDELTTLRQQLEEAKEKNQYLSVKWSESDLKRYRIESENAALKKEVEELRSMGSLAEMEERLKRVVEHGNASRDEFAMGLVTYLDSMGGCDYVYQNHNLEYWLNEYKKTL